jgi:hypothetical protein
MLQYDVKSKSMYDVCRGRPSPVLLFSMYVHTRSECSIPPFPSDYRLPLLPHTSDESTLFLESRYPHHQHQHHRVSHVSFVPFLPSPTATAETLYCPTDTPTQTFETSSYLTVPPSFGTYTPSDTHPRTSDFRLLPTSSPSHCPVQDNTFVSLRDRDGYLLLLLGLTIVTLPTDRHCHSPIAAPRITTNRTLSAALRLSSSHDIPLRLPQHTL